jgi:hypothetical protein
MAQAHVLRRRELEKADELRQLKMRAQQSGVQRESEQAEIARLVADMEAKRVQELQVRVGFGCFCLGVSGRRRCGMMCCDLFGYICLTWNLRLPSQTNGCLALQNVFSHAIMSRSTIHLYILLSPHRPRRVLSASAFASNWPIPIGRSCAHSRTKRSAKWHRHVDNRKSIVASKRLRKHVFIIMHFHPISGRV